MPRSPRRSTLAAPAPMFLTTAFLPSFLPVFFTALLMALLTVLTFAASASAQDWGTEPDDSWGPPPDRRAYDPYPAERVNRGEAFDRGEASQSGWSARAGVGFTADPTSLLLNFEFPYYFDRFVAVGPMLQVGTDDDKLIVAPTLDLTITIPNIGVAGLERAQPYGFVGLGFAVVEDDDRADDNSATDFLIHFGVGIEYQISERLFLGSHMTFNFLPDEALGQTFFYSWQVGGARIAF